MNRIYNLMCSKTKKEQKQILERVFDKLYDRALELKEYNYCQVKCGTCFAARLNKDNKKLYRTFNGCCAGCKHLGSNGCKVEALACRAWTCGILRDRSGWTFGNRDTNSVFHKLNYLNKRIRRWKLDEGRADRKTAIAVALNRFKYHISMPQNPLAYYNII